MEVFQQEGLYREIEGFPVLHYQYEDHWTFSMEPWHEETTGDPKKSMDEWFEGCNRQVTDAQPNYSVLPHLSCANCDGPAWDDYLCAACRGVESQP